MNDSKVPNSIKFGRAISTQNLNETSTQNKTEKLKLRKRKIRFST